MKKNNRIFWLVFISLLLLTLFPFFQAGVPNGWDTSAHLSRIAVFHQALDDHAFPPRWSTYLSWGFGSPVLLFNWSLPYYMADIFLRLGYSLIDSFKAVMILSTLGSFVFMYLFLSRITSPLPALAGAMLYIWSPYHFNILFLRGAVGEAVGLMFFPFVFFSTTLLFQKQILWGFFLSVIGWSCILLSHQALFLMILPVWIAYILFLYGKSKDTKALLSLLISLVLGIGIDAFFWIPAFLEKNMLGFFRITTLFSDNFLSFQTLLASPFLPLGNPSWRLMYSPGWPLLCIFVGAFLALIITMFRKQWNTKTSLLLLFTSFCCLSLFLLVPQSRFLWERIPLLSSLVYPQRFLGLFTFLTSIIVALLLEPLKKRVAFILLILILLLLSTYPYLNLKEASNPNIRTFDTTVFTSTDMSGEFLPKAIPTDFVANGPRYGEQPLVLHNGNPIPNTQCRQTSTSVSCNMTVNTPSIIRFRQFNFPGWSAYGDMEKLPITSDIDGTILVHTKTPITHIRIAFETTLLRTSGMIVSFCSIIITLFLFVFQKKFIPS